VTRLRMVDKAAETVAAMRTAFGNREPDPTSPPDPPGSVPEAEIENIRYLSLE
jgi:hypothetical protein